MHDWKITEIYFCHIFTNKPHHHPEKKSQARNAVMVFRAFFISEESWNTSPELWKKGLGLGLWLFRALVGDEILPGYVGIIFVSPFIQGSRLLTITIQWKLRPGFVFYAWLTWKSWWNRRFRGCNLISIVRANLEREMARKIKEKLK